MGSKGDFLGGSLHWKVVLDLQTVRNHTGILIFSLKCSGWSSLSKSRRAKWARWCLMRMTLLPSRWTFPLNLLNLISWIPWILPPDRWPLPLVLATFKNLPAERVPSECSQSRYIADIFIKDIFFPVPIYCRYIVSWHCPEQPLAPKSFPQSCCQCRGWLRIGCWILFYGMSWSSGKYKWYVMLLVHL